MLTIHGIYQEKCSCSLTPIKHFAVKKKLTLLGGKKVEANEWNGKIFKSHFRLANYANPICRCQKLQFKIYEVK